MKIHIDMTVVPVKLYISMPALFARSRRTIDGGPIQQVVSAALNPVLLNGFVG